MKRSATGVMNGNFRNGDYYRYAKSVENTANENIGSCGHPLVGRPLFLVGTSNLCYSCWLDENEEQGRILNNITAEAHEEYIANLVAAAYMDAQDPAQRDADTQAQEVEKNGWAVDAIAEHKDWLDEQETRESVRPL